MPKRSREVFKRSIAGVLIAAGALSTAACIEINNEPPTKPAPSNVNPLFDEASFTRLGQVRELYEKYDPDGYIPLNPIYTQINGDRFSNLTHTYSSLEMEMSTTIEFTCRDNDDGSRDLITRLNYSNESKAVTPNSSICRDGIVDRKDQVLDANDHFSPRYDDVNLKSEAPSTPEF